MPPRSDHDRKEKDRQPKRRGSDAARVRRIRGQSPIYLATAAFLVLGAFVFCESCQYEARGTEETTQVDGRNRHTVSVFLVVAALTLASVFLTAALTYDALSACD